MIKIVFYKNAFNISGHANFKEKNDIICAGISAIVEGSLNWFIKNDIFLEKQDGLIKLIVTNINDDYIYKLELLWIQLNAIHHSEYKKHIEIIDKREEVL